MLSGCVGAFSVSIELKLLIVKLTLILRVLPQIPLFTLMTSLVAMMEALSEQNDNLTLPIWGWCLGVLLRL